MNSAVYMLDSIKVLDITNNIAGPTCGLFLAEHGADVIHVEKPVTGDDNRGFPPHFSNGEGIFSSWEHQGKKSVVLNFKDPVGHRLFLDMAKDADVIVESYKPGVTKRLGIDYETIRQINPRIIYCSISAYGQDGPYSSRPGYDIIAQAYSGLIDKTGEADEAPTKVGSALVDYVASYNAFAGVAMALFHRQKTGLGQAVNVSLARGISWMNAISDEKCLSETRSGRYDSYTCPHGIFAAPKGEYIALGAALPDEWDRLCRAMDHTDLITNPDFSTNEARCQRKETVARIIEDWMAAFPDATSVLRALDNAGITNGKVNKRQDLLDDKHINQAGWIRQMPVPEGVTEVSSLPAFCGTASFSESDIRVAPGPTLGQHNVSVLSQYGLTEEEILSIQETWAAQK